MGLLGILCIFKGILFFSFNKKLTKEEYEGDYYVLLKTFGFEIYNRYLDPKKDGSKFIQLKIWNSFDFEFLAMFFNALLYIFYQSNIRDENKPLGYINNTLFLKQYRKFQYVFFATIVFDALFAITFIQMIMLAFMFSLLIFWAKQNFDENKELREERFERRIDISAKCVRVLVNIQLASLSLFQVAFLKGKFINYPRFSEIMQAVGLETNPEARFSQVR